MRNSSNGLTEPTIRSSSAYLRLLKWKPPSRPASASRPTICSTFDALGVVAEVDEHLGPLAERLADEQRGAPVGQVGGVEGGLEELVLDEQRLLRRQLGVDLPERVEQPPPACAQVVLAGVVRAVREPQRLGVGAERARDLEALEQVLDGLGAHAGVGMRDGAELVVGVLEEVRVDRADAQPALLHVRAQVVVVVHRVPREVHRHGAGGAGEAVHLGGVVDALADVARAARLREHAEARARVAVAPGGGLDHEVAQRGLDRGRRPPPGRRAGRPGRCTGRSRCLLPGVLAAVR